MFARSDLTANPSGTSGKAGRHDPKNKIKNRDLEIRNLFQLSRSLLSVLIQLSQSQL
jgi:hypothetical protein